MKSNDLLLLHRFLLCYHILYLVTACNNTHSNSVVIEPSANTITEAWSVILGGYDNTVLGRYSSVLGGVHNVIVGKYDAIVGGIGNTVVGSNAAILASNNSSALGLSSIVMIGDHSTTHGRGALSVGYSAHANHDFSGVFNFATSHDEEESSSSSIFPSSCQSAGTGTLNICVGHGEAMINDTLASIFINNMSLRKIIDNVVEVSIMVCNKLN